MDTPSLSIKTPSYSHLNSDDFNYIYPPSEDTFLLIDALEKDLQQIIELKPSLCLEIGVGSGLVITALGTVLRQSCKYIGTDINPVACAKAKETGRLNGVQLETHCCDLASGIPEDLKGRVDVLLFNPPYVATESEEVAAGPLELTWAGGKDGREVVDRLLPQLSTLLSTQGLFYLVLEKNNKPQEIKEAMGCLGFHSECVLERRSAMESLSVLKFNRKC